MNNSFYHENSHAWASSQFILRFFRQINILTNSPHKFYSYIIFLRYFLLLLFSHEIMSIIFRENGDKKRQGFFFVFLFSFVSDFFFFRTISWNLLLLLMHLHHSLLISWKHKSSWMIKICHSVIFREFITFLWVMVIQDERVFSVTSYVERRACMYGTCFLEGIFFTGFITS